MLKYRLAGVVFLSVFCLLSVKPVQGEEAQGKDGQTTASQCKSVSIDTTGSEVLALLANAQAVAPVGTPQVTYSTASAVATRSLGQDFEITNPDGTKTTVTVTCKSSLCGAGCATVGCDPGSDGKVTWCTACSCRPQPPALTCVPNACTCEKTTTSTSGTTTAGE